MPFALRPPAQCVHFRTPHPPPCAPRLLSLTALLLVDVRHAREDGEKDGNE
jgi:hypothetical protein